MLSLESPEGRPSKTRSPEIVTTTEAAKALNVSVPTVNREKAKIRGKTKPKIAPPPTNGEAIDDMGIPVPKQALAYWDRKGEAKMVLGQISAARSQVKKLMPDDPMWSAVNLNGVLGELSSAYNRFSAAIPAYVCPYCEGKKPDNCLCCKGKGVISKFVWNTVPEELRKKREKLV